MAQALTPLEGKGRKVCFQVRHQSPPSRAQNQTVNTLCKELPPEPPHPHPAIPTALVRLRQPRTPPLCGPLTVASSFRSFSA